MQKIVIIDDEAQFRQNIADSLHSIREVDERFDITALDETEFKKMRTELNDRYDRYRRGKNVNEGECILDETSILIIDYDLFELGLYGPLKADGLIYQARCFSDCGLIISLNKDQRLNPFDLTLMGDVESFADWDLGSKQMRNAGLWTTTFSGFRPWYWPIMPKALESFESRADEIVGKLDDPILEQLGLSSVEGLSESAVRFLGSKAGEITFNDFFTNSGKCLSGKDCENSNLVTDKRRASIIASRLGKWMELNVLPGQDILIDAPHLVSRYPSLLRGSPDAIESWNATTAISDKITDAIDTGKISKYEFRAANWFSRPVWYWNKIMNSDEIPEVGEPWTFKESSYAFCEDSSRFHPKEECTMFVARGVSEFSMRFLKHFGTDVDYYPKKFISIPDGA
ncbi:MAG: hypothetical protein E4G74_02310 [Erysipelotrichales bacterium]|nr:MAG: hypothetical protein E4G74_02310 [Erysipelotrichales bacterium]